MTISIVTITGTGYSVYGSIAGADAFIKGRAGAAFDAWRALVAAPGLTLDETKARLLVTMTTFLDEQGWQGARTVSSQALEWPRIGVIDCAGVAVDSSIVPEPIVRANYVGAALLALNPNPPWVTQGTTGQNIQSATAGPVSVTFFRATLGTEEASIMPAQLMRIVECYLAQARVAGETVYASGFDTEEARRSSFSDDAQHGFDGPII
jgi:hypothetical protein